MARLPKVQTMVYNALSDHPKTRTDDFLLVLEVLKNFITQEMRLETALEQHEELGLPSFASILRTRRKLQRMYPELVNPTTAQMREAAEEDYKKYALEKMSAI